jgi:ferric-dicitrate binding protein FerR (iron transport regulator)
MKRFALIAALAAAATAAVAQGTPDATAPPAVVDAVQMPAWIERGGARVPLAPGMGLQSSDALRTGVDARILVKLADGSSVKLGENAQLQLATIATRKDNVFVSAMSVLQGAFRFTTDALAKSRRRDVTVTVATVTAGIRGTDLWGKAAADRDIVCLIEGRIEVSRQGDPTITMDQPLSFYIAPRGQPAQPVAPVNPEQLKQWATETEIADGRGAARRGGRWKVVLASGESENEVLTVYQAVRAAGYAAELEPRRVQGKRSYDVRIASLPSEAEAEALARSLDGRYGVSSPRVAQ